MEIPAGGAAAGPPDATGNHKHIPALDALRGIAVLMVIVVHFGSGFEPQTATEVAVYRFFRLGWSGVDLFFVLSGFLITGILLETRRSAAYFKSFYMRRFLRIFPLYYAFLALYMFGLAPLLLHRDLIRSIDWKEAPWYWVYLQNFRLGMGHSFSAGLGHFWSLAIEEQFYMFWPLVVLRLGERALFRLCVGGALASLLLRIAFAGQGIGAPDFIYVVTPFRLEPLFIGAAGAIVMRNPAWRERARGLTSGFILSGLLGLIAASALAGTTSPYAPTMARIGYTSVGWIFLALVFSAADRTLAGRPVWRPLRNKFFRSCGKYSYAMYVFHFPISPVVCQKIAHLVGEERRLLVPFLAIPVGILISYGAGALSYVCFEKHFLRLKDYFKATPGAVPAAVPLAIGAPAGPEQ